MTGAASALESAVPGSFALPMPLRFPPPVVRTAFALALVVIFWLAMIPLPEALTVFSFQDKVEHTGAFVLLTLMGVTGFPLRRTAVAAGLVAYGLLIEVCQHRFTTNRVGDPWDWLADSVGVFIGLRLAGWFARRVVNIAGA